MRPPGGREARNEMRRKRRRLLREKYLMTVFLHTVFFLERSVILYFKRNRTTYTRRRRPSGYWGIIEKVLEETADQDILDAANTETMLKAVDGEFTPEMSF